MSRYILSLAMVAAVLSLIGTSTAIAADSSHEGTVVSAGAGKLTMTKTGETAQHSHDVGDDAKITLDGRPAKLEDLKAGFHVKVTLDANKAVASIEAKTKAAPVVP